MEEVLLNIDSRYRDIFIYPNECKFRYNLEKMYKNIIFILLRIVLETYNDCRNVLQKSKFPKDNFHRHSFLFFHRIEARPGVF